MQKQVSKQSLAIVALSILLAICMALTATYAAFQQNASVKGQITFTAPSTSLTLSYDESIATSTVQEAVAGKISVAAQSVTITLTQGDFVYDANDKVAPNANIMNALKGLQYRFTVSANAAPSTYTFGYAYAASNTLEPSDETDYNTADVVDYLPLNTANITSSGAPSATTEAGVTAKIFDVANIFNNIAPSALATDAGSTLEFIIIFDLHINNAAA